ncbi:hypothetical protein [Nocardia puris]|uniref:hypothetical protein n=1 Tax=Nocardia puris TaxID=208602 RepID=UPI0011BEFF86|nr:hypothetical protein [Nocardia puris]
MAAGNEVDQVDIGDIGIAVVQVDVDPAAGLINHELQPPALRRGLQAVGESDGPWPRPITILIRQAEIDGVGLRSLSSAPPDGTFLAINGELDQFEGFLGASVDAAGRVVVPGES